MRIGVDIRSLNTDEPSGVSQYLEHLLLNLLKSDSKNSYLLFSNSFKGPIKGLKEKFDFPNVTFKFSRIPNKLFHLGIVFLNYPKLDELLGGVDLFFIPNPQFLSLSGKCRKIVVLHDCSFRIQPNFYSFKRRLWHRFVKIERILREVDFVITDAESSRKDIARVFKIAETKISVVSPGLEPVQVDQNRLTEVKKKFELADKYILYLGNLEKRKNWEGFFEAFDSYRQKIGHQVQLVVAGGFYDSAGRVKKAIKKLADPSAIKLLGYVSKEDRDCLLSGASIFLYPSFYEGFGFPPLEAMARGVPVIASNSSSFPEVLKGAALTIDPYRPAEITTALIELDRDLNLRQQLITKGFEVVKNYDWEKTASGVLEIFNKIVNI